MCRRIKVAPMLSSCLPHDIVYSYECVLWFRQKQIMFFASLSRLPLSLQSRDWILCRQNPDLSSYTSINDVKFESLLLSRFNLFCWRKKKSFQSLRDIHCFDVRISMRCVCTRRICKYTFSQSNHANNIVSCLSLSTSVYFPCQSEKYQNSWNRKRKWNVKGWKRRHKRERRRLNWTWQWGRISFLAGCRK